MSLIIQQAAGLVLAMGHIAAEVGKQRDVAIQKGAIFDSAAATQDVAKAVIVDDTGSRSEGFQQLQKLAAYLDGAAGQVLDSASRAIGVWQQKFGMPIPDNVLHAGINRALSLFEPVDGSPECLQQLARMEAQMDSASNAHHDQLSIRSGLALASLLSTIASATPFAGVVPFPMGSNEGKIVLVTPKAANDYGAYREGDYLVGSNAGKPFTMSGRLQIPTETAGVGNTAYAVDVRECVLFDSVNGGWIPDPNTPTCRILSGRTKVMVNGITVATDQRQGGSVTAQNSGSTVINGSFKIKGSNTDYVLTGTCDLNNGAVDFTITPSLPNTASVKVMAFIDWEREKSRAVRVNRWASIGVATEGYSVFAEEARVESSYTISAATQFTQELGMNIAAMSMGAAEFHNEERFRRLIELGAEIAKNNPQPILNLDVSGQIIAKTIGEAITDEIMIRIENVIKDFVTQAWSTRAGSVLIPPELAPIFRRILGFVTGSAIQSGIYLVGYLPNGLPVYSVPQMTHVFGYDETGETSAFLVIGSDMGDPARSPILMGDAVPFMPVNINNQYDRNYEAASGWYGRSLTDLNPNIELAGVWAIVPVIGLNRS